jgi:UDP-N-acetylglucosamine 2-epimerase
MQNILSVVGTRPEAIKMAPVIKKLEGYPKHFKSVVCVTGQHRKMLDQALDLFKIRPDYDLNVMHHNQDLSILTANLLIKLDELIKDIKPDWILAQGDTTSVMTASLAAFYNRISFGHVEAGLRTGNRRNPFPEEINRKIADSLADTYFTPTEKSRQNLIIEGCNEDKIFVTGNTVIDSLLMTADISYDWSKGPLSKIPQNKKIVLVTAHRRESFGKALKEICKAVRNLAIKYSTEVHFVYPVHLNPNVQKPVNKILSGVSNIALVDPLDYLSFVHLMNRSSLILTDSGGIQEEAPSFGVPVLVMRDTTERPEGIEAGCLQLVGTKERNIVKKSTLLLNDKNLHLDLAKIKNPYGDGHAAERIVAILLKNGRSARQDFSPIKLLSSNKNKPSDLANFARN